MRLISQDWTSQPARVTRVKPRWTNFMVLYGYRNMELTDPLSSVDWTSTSATTGTARSGRSWKFNGSSTYISKTEATLKAITGGFTVMSVCTPRTVTTADYSLGFGNSVDTNPIIGLANNGTTASTAVFICRNNTGGAVSEAQVAGELVANKESVLIGTYRGTTMRLNTRGGTGTATYTAATTTLNRTAVGCLLRNTASGFFTGEVSLWAAWNRALTQREVYDLLKNPWVMFERQPIGLYRPAASILTSSRGRTIMGSRLGSRPIMT